MSTENSIKTSTRKDTQLYTKELKALKKQFRALSDYRILKEM